MVRNASSGPNITAGRTKSASLNAARTAISPSPRFSNVLGWCGCIRADSRNVNKPLDSRATRLSCHPLGRLDVNGVKSVLSMLNVKADRIHDAVSAGERVHD